MTLQHRPDCCCRGATRRRGAGSDPGLECRGSRVALPVGPAQRLGGGGHWVWQKGISVPAGTNRTAGAQGQVERRREERASRRWRGVRAGGPGVQPWVVLKTRATHWREAAFGEVLILGRMWRRAEWTQVVVCTHTGTCASSRSPAKPGRAGAPGGGPGPLGWRQGEEPRHRGPGQRVEPGGLLVPTLGSRSLPGPGPAERGRAGEQGAELNGGTSLHLWNGRLW